MSKARDIADLGAVTSRLDTVGASDGALSNRNLIINGAMQVAQRGSGPFTNASGGYQTVDRFQLSGTMGGSFTLEQASDAPSGSGFQKSFKALAPTGFASPTSAARARITTSLEGQNLQQLLKGTADAVSVTFSFWVKAVVTGTYIFEVYDDNNNRTISTAYSISASNTWEKKIITISGDTSGVLNNTNGSSLSVVWWIGAGSNFTSGTLNTSWNATVTANRAVGQVNAVASNNDAFYLTGVQLEVGDTATPFEHRSYGDELQRCSRYTHVLKPEQAYGRYRATYNDIGVACNTFYEFPVEMRSVPTLINNNMSSSTFQCYSETDGGFRNPTGAFTLADSSKRHAWMSCNTATATAGAVGMWRWNNYPSASMVFDAEL